MERITWIVLGYQIPVTPSKKRVYVWRKLKEMGATYFRQGVAMLPKSQTNILRFQTLADKIIEMGGEATLGELRYLSKQDEMRAVAEFRKQSKQEYQKILKDMRLLSSTLRTEGHMSEPDEEKARRLGQKLAQIKARDYFLFRREPEVSAIFEELLHDMAQVKTQLKEYLGTFLHND